MTSVFLDACRFAGWIMNKTSMQNDGHANLLMMTKRGFFNTIAPRITRATATLYRATNFDTFLLAARSDTFHLALDVALHLRMLFVTEKLGEVAAAISTLRQLQSLTIILPNKIKSSDFDMLVSSARVISNLDMSWTSNLTDSCLETLGASPAAQRHLHTLDLSGCMMWVNDAALQHLEGLKNLRKLDVSSCARLSDTCLVNSISRLTSLRILRLSCIASISARGVSTLHESLLSLEELALPQCVGLTDEFLLNPRGAVVVDPGMASSLRVLELDACRSLTDGALALIGQTMLRLEALSLTACVGITDEGLKQLHNVNSLRTLSLNSCKQITDVGIANLLGLSQLESLYLQECGITDASLENSISRMPTINTLMLSYTTISDAGVAALLKLPALKSADLSKCDKVTKTARQTLEKAMAASRIVT